MSAKIIASALMMLGAVCFADGNSNQKKQIKCSLGISATNIANYEDSCIGTYAFEDNGGLTLEFPCQARSAARPRRYSAVVSFQTSSDPESNVMLRIFDQAGPQDIRITESTTYFGNDPLPGHFRIALSPTQTGGNVADYQASLVCDRTEK